MADRGEALFGTDSLPKGAAAGDGHIHFGMAFHAPGDAFIGLLFRLLEEIAGKKSSKQDN